MMFERSSHFGFHHSLDALKSAVVVATEKGSTFGHVHNYRDGFYLFHSQSSLTIITPSLLSLLTTERDIMVALALEGDQLYLLIKQNDFIVGEYLFDASDNNSNEMKLALTAFYVLDKQLNDFKLFTNAKISTSDHNTCILNNKINLPISADNAEYKAWLNGELTAATETNQISLSQLLPFKQIPQLKAKPWVKPMALASALLFTSLCWLFTGSGEHQPPLATPNSVEANPYQGLIQHLTEEGANPLFIFSQVTRRMNVLNTLVGWQINQVDVRQNKGRDFALLITLTSTTGGVTELMAFGRNHGYTVNLDGDRAFLHVGLGFMPVLSTPARFHLGSYQRLMTQRLDYFWDDITTKFSRDSKFNKTPYIIEDIDIKIANVAAADINALGSLFYGDPFSLVALKLKRDKDGLAMFSAALKMTLAGVVINE